MRLIATGMLLAGASLAATALAAAPQTTLVTPVPEAREVPTTTTSYPFLDTRHNLVPFDLAGKGYEEVETFVSGKARLYDWGQDGKPVVKSEDSPYATRILVRRPKDKARFSGNVVVEIMLDARSSDWAMMWGYLKDKIVRDGDVWVGITLPKSTQSLKKFDAARYAPLTFAPATPLACKTNEAGDQFEEGLRFDMIAEVGALLKSAAPANPLAGYGPDRRLLMTEQGTDVSTFAAAFQTLLRLADGQPIYDGYLFKTQRADLARLNHCGQPIPASDPRTALKNIGVPVISVVSPGEVFTTAAARREDSDDRADPFRRYEVPAGNHLDAFAYSGFPDLADQQKGGILQGTQEWPFGFRCTPETQLSVNPVMKYVFSSSMQHLADWAKTGKAPPRAPRITLVAGANGKQQVALDKNGIAMGGIRTVFADLPTSADALGAPGPGNCREIGGTVEYSWAYLSSLYGSPQAYARKASAAIDANVKAGWILPADAQAWKAEISAPAKPPVMPAIGAFGS